MSHTPLTSQPTSISSIHHFFYTSMNVVHIYWSHFPRYVKVCNSKAWKVQNIDYYNILVIPTAQFGTTWGLCQHPEWGPGSWGNYGFNDHPFLRLFLHLATLLVNPNAGSRDTHIIWATVSFLFCFPLTVIGRLTATFGTLQGSLGWTSDQNTTFPFLLRFTYWTTEFVKQNQHN